MDDEARVSASISAISNSSTPAISIAASLLAMWLRRSENHASLIASVRNASDLLLALWPFEDQHVIDLAAGLIDARDRRDQKARPNRADIGAVLGVEVSRSATCRARGVPIPGQRIEIVANRMERIVAGRHLHRASDITEASVDVFASGTTLAFATRDGQSIARRAFLRPTADACESRRAH